MKTLILDGHLGERFGREFLFDVASPKEAIRALCYQVPGFRQYLKDHSEPGYQVIVGDKPRSVEELSLKTARDTIRFVPVIAGAGGAVRTIVGVILIIVGTYFDQPWMVNIGVSLTVSGIAAMLAPKPPPPGTNERPDNKPSFTFSGPVNTDGQGMPVPWLFGRLEIGSIVGSASLQAMEYDGSTLGAPVVVGPIGSSKS